MSDRLADVEHLLDEALAAEQDVARAAVHRIACAANKVREGDAVAMSLQSSIRIQLDRLLADADLRLTTARYGQKRAAQRQLVEEHLPLFLGIARSREPSGDASVIENDPRLDELAEFGLIEYGDGNPPSLTPDGWTQVRDFEMDLPRRRAVASEYWELLREIDCGGATVDGLRGRGLDDIIEAGLANLLDAALIRTAEEGRLVSMTPAGKFIVSEAADIFRGTDGLIARKGRHTSEARDAHYAVAAGFGDIQALDRAENEQPREFERLRRIGTRPESGS